METVVLTSETADNIEEDCTTCHHGHRDVNKIDCRFPVPSKMPVAWSYKAVSLDSDMSCYRDDGISFKEINLFSNGCPCWEPKGIHP